MANKTKYSFNGQKNLAKNRLVLEVIKKYIKDTPNITYSELKEIFYDKLQGSIGVIKNENDLLKWEENKSESNKRTRRFFVNDVIKINNDNIYVCTEWGSGEKENIDSFVDYVKKNLNYEISYSNSDNKILKTVDKIDGSRMNIKNIILYGAPGVGKTHNYQNLISMIENGKGQKDIFDTISNSSEPVELNNSTFQIIKDEKRVEFVTFHQSYSYEDFIEGFRPNESGNIELEDGIFKQISDEAKTNLENSQKQIETIREEKKFEELFDLFKDYIEDTIDKNKKFDINETVYITNIEQDAFRYQGDNWGNSQRMKFSDIELLYNTDNYERKEIKKVHNISGLAKQHATYFSYFMKHFLEFKKKQKIEIYNIYKIDLKNFYIVIDEINRGNISKIFGELITLIEEDKRDTYEVTLPYSKEKFKVPSNLYIIATMNSTDKSIATIDIALRRRFTFLKMKPNLALVENDNAREMMEKLNNYITKNLGEDYQLGHSYFMKVQNDDDLEFVKEYKIKPLLEEYFYADEKSADDILDEALKN